jgi:hypothetical protein
MSLTDGYLKQLKLHEENFREKAEVYDQPGQTWADKFPHGLPDVSFCCYQKVMRLLSAEKTAEGLFSEEASRAITDCLRDLANYATMGLAMLDENGG